MSSPVSFFLTPPEGLAGVLTPSRLAALRTSVTEMLAEMEELDDDDRLLTELIDHLAQNGGNALARLPERLSDAVIDLLDTLADDLVHAGEHAYGEPLELATALHPDERDLQAAEAVIGAACPEATQRLWRFTVWGRIPGQEGPSGIGLKRMYPGLGYWTSAEVRQLRESLREHLSGAPDYRPMRGGPRFRAWLQRALSLASRGDPSRALDAATQALDKAARQGSGLLFAR